MGDSAAPGVGSAVRGMEAVLLVNTRSRKGAALLEVAPEKLKARGFRLVGSFAVHDTRWLAEAVRRAVAMEPPLLIVGGGDGTVSYVASHLAYRETALGVLPLGTTNNFARDIGIPLDLDAALDLLTSGQVVEVDLGQIGDHFFGNVTSIGVTAEVARTTVDSLKRRIGRAAYVIAGARALTTHPPFEVTVTTAERTYNFRTHQLIIANGAFHGGKRIAQDADIEDCRLTIFPIGDERLLSAVFGMLSFQYGRTRSVREGVFISTTEALIETLPERDIEIDGEVLDRTPARVAIACKALKVIARNQ